MRQIFISYTQQDEAFALRLVSDLRMGGARVWIDVQNAEPGRHWGRSIERALAESKMMIVVLSPEALESAHVMVEWQAYLEAYRPVIPVIARPCTPPGPLRTRRPVDFSRDVYYSRALHDLTTRLIESGLRIRRSDPVIWTLVENMRSLNEDESPEGYHDLPGPAASDPPPGEADDWAAVGLRRMVQSLRDILLGRGVV